MTTERTTVPCKWCGTPTRMLGTRECDPCWNRNRHGDIPYDTLHTYYSIFKVALEEISETAKGYPNGSREGEIALTALAKVPQ